MVSRTPIVLVVLILALLVMAAASPAPTGAHPPRGEPVEILAFGTATDDLRLLDGDPPAELFVVPEGRALVLTDNDVYGHFVYLHRDTDGEVEQVAWLSAGGPSSEVSARSFEAGIRFGPGSRVLVQADLSSVEWLALKGLLVRSR